MNVANQQQIVGGLRHASTSRTAIAVAAAALIVLAAAITWVALGGLQARVGPSADVTATGASIPNAGLVEFRRGEQGAEAATTGATAPNPGFVDFRRGEQGASDAATAGSGALNAALEEFRRGERGD